MLYSRYLELCKENGIAPSTLAIQLGYSKNPTFRAIKKVPILGTFSMFEIPIWYHFGITLITTILFARG